MIYLPENLALDLMTLLIYHHPEERKQTRIPKDKEGVSGKSQKHFSHLMAIQTITSPTASYAVGAIRSKPITRQKLHSNVAPAKTNSRENKFQISKYQLTSTKLFASTSENTKTNSNHRVTTTVSTADPANQILIQ